MHVVMSVFFRVVSHRHGMVMVVMILHGCHGIGFGF